MSADHFLFLGFLLGLHIVFGFEDDMTACGSCRRYLKAIDVKRAGRPFFLPLDTVATLPLDQAVVEQGFQAG